MLDVLAGFEARQRTELDAAADPPVELPKLGTGQQVVERGLSDQHDVQRARAFVSGAPILLMDEPFGSLDAQTRWVLQAELLRIWEQDRKLVVFVTHDIQEAVLLADRVLVMTGRPGRIREEISVPLGRPRDLPRDQRNVSEITWHIWRLLEEEVRDGLSVRN